MKVLELTLPKVNVLEVLRYMGVKKPTDLDVETAKKNLATLPFKPKAKVVYEKYPINISGDLLDLTFTKTNSALIKKALQGANEVILFVATIGLEIDRLINKYSLTKPSTALFYQALGTERVEALCDEFCAYLSKEYAPLTLTKRFSPGYGDIPLSMQKDVFSALNPTKYVGVSLLDSMLMSPTKSVTAIVGVTNSKKEENLEKCSICTSDNCNFRK